MRMLEQLQEDYPDQVAETARAAASIAGGWVVARVGGGVRASLRELVWKPLSDSCCLGAVCVCRCV